MIVYECEREYYKHTLFKKDEEFRGLYLKFKDISCTFGVLEAFLRETYDFNFVTDDREFLAFSSTLWHDSNTKQLFKTHLQLSKLVEFYYYKIILFYQLNFIDLLKIDKKNLNFIGYEN